MDDSESDDIDASRETPLGTSSTNTIGNSLLNPFTTPMINDSSDESSAGNSSHSPDSSMFKDKTCDPLIGKQIRRAIFGTQLENTTGSACPGHGDISNSSSDVVISK